VLLDHRNLWKQLAETVAQEILKVVAKPAQYMYNVSITNTETVRHTPQQIKEGEVDKDTE
jgi:hypothetical protein